MARIGIKILNEDQDKWVFLVEVEDKGTKTEHKVTVNREFYESLSKGACSPEEFVNKSFEFLLERESKESILREFNISKISYYFPEYIREITKLIS
ncbi:MAG: hypothetical protein AMJ45_04740 [Syntrophobacter sp. DG_60]|nr:MAG: hypothetical protein AMJ45_04740 [Syntrophobacter sp. DG_60]